MLKKMMNMWFKQEEHLANIYHLLIITQETKPKSRVCKTFDTPKTKQQKRKTLVHMYSNVPMGGHLTR